MSGRDTLLLAAGWSGDRAFFRSLLEEEYNILEAENGSRTLLLAEQYQRSLAAVLLDAALPDPDGYAVLEELKRRDVTAQAPVILLNAENEARAFDLGACDNIRRPFQPRVILRRIRNLVELNRHQKHLEELVEEQAAILRKSNEAIIDTLTSVIEYRSLESGQHIRRIRLYTRLLLEELARSAPEYGLDARKIDMIANASALHDIGKIVIPDGILNKAAPLTPEESMVMRTHTEMGGRIIEGLQRTEEAEYLDWAEQICRCHHERWDGNGYPKGLRGDQIPVAAQVVGVADAYDALTSDRVYKEAIPHEKALNMILNGECGAFSVQLLECLKRVQEDFKRLALAYADGEEPPDEPLPTVLACAAPAIREGNGIGLALLQEKYQALLRYLDATVVELDLEAGIYHVVYAPNPDFDLLRTGSTFGQSMRNLVEGAVCPEDRDLVRNDNLERFFAQGFTRRTRRYRVFHVADGTYHWYDATFLRLDTGQATGRRGLAIWQESAHRRQAEQRNTALRHLLGGVLCCWNDRWYTLTGPLEGLSALVGYTKEEVRVRFQNSLLLLIHPEDREEARRKTQEQLARGANTEMEYRMVHKDGRIIWILEKSRLVVEPDGRECLYCVLMDVTRTKQAQEELRLMLERHQIILDQTNDIIFEWDIASDRVEYSNNWEKTFGYAPLRERTIGRIQEASHIYPEDIPLLQKQVKAMLDGAPYAETELRIAKADGHYLWCRVRATVQNGKDGRPIKVVGVIVDIDEDKRSVQALRARAERDALTRLYNKAYARGRIEDYLEHRPGTERAALLVIDVDNFKQVNDQYGHMFGDAVLTRIADEIRSLFRSMDIISRIGGDEFMVFLQRIPNEELVQERCAQLVEAFQGLFREQFPNCALSCSVGVALVPEHGQAFQELFQRADQALYQAKRQGKNRFLLYSLAAPGFAGTTAASTRIDSDQRPALSTDGLVRYALRLFYESGDAEEAVAGLLELVGQQFQVSRAYVYENTPDNAACVNTFEWCSRGMASQKEQLQWLEYVRDLGPDFQRLFDEHGVLYCPDITRLPRSKYEILASQGVKSMLQCAIRDNGQFRGFVGFDECTAKRLWTQEQIDVLVQMSEIISVFLLKKRAQDKLTRWADDLRCILDAQDDWIYVIHPDTYQMKFINAKPQSLFPEAKAGMYCYQAFADRDSPCQNCPVRDIRQLGRRSVEIYNGHLRLWMQVNAAMIQWSGEEACLITGRDITAYKQGGDREGEPCGGPS